MKIMLIDGNSIINRAFYGLPLLTNKDGEYTNAVYGFLNIFFRLYDEEKPERVAVAFDLPAPTFRHKMYGEYKGTRKSMPEELRPQLPLLKNMLRKMEVATFEQEGYEADDILGTLAKKAEENGHRVVVISGDRDLLQLATETIKIRIPKTKAGKTEVEDYFAADVLEKMGVSPIEYIDVKALMGDASDNIPGVPGIGEKTATKIIQDYKTIENAIANAAEIKPKKASENLETYKEQAILSKELATIIIDADIKIDFESMLANNLYNEEALEEVKRLGFRTIIERFLKTASVKEPEANSNYKMIKSVDELKKLVGELVAEKEFAIGLTYLQDECIGYSVASSTCEGVFVPSEYFKDSQELFISNVGKIMLDSKKDKTQLKKLGMEINNIIFDISLAAYILDSKAGSYLCGDIAEMFLDGAVSGLKTEEALVGKGKNKKTIKTLSDQEVVDFAASQADILFRAYPILLNKLKESDQEKLYFEMEFPLAEVLFDMEISGIKVNRDELIAFGKVLDGYLEELTKEIYILAGEEFNINSPMQLGKILFEKLGLKGSKKTTQGYSTAADILEKLKDKDPIINKILEFRTYMKLKSTYVEGLLATVDKESSKIHSTFMQTIAATGRISSVEPNLQNIPVRLSLGRELRKVFVPSDDSFVFLDGDYSQIELRVLAHIAHDKTMIEAFENGEDIHRLTASQVFKIPLDEVTNTQRSNAKAVNFGIVYGISSFSLSQDLGIMKKEADRYIAGYFEKYPQIKEYLDRTIIEAREEGFAKTIFNRRRPIPELNASNFNERSFGERVAMNMPIQGSAADIIKIAMINVHRKLKERNFSSRLILQVHDELLLEVKKDELEQVRELVKNEMENAVDLSVTMRVDLHEGNSWFEAK